MPLSILLPMVIGGIAGIAVLLHVLGLSRRVLIPDAETSMAAWDDEYSSDRARTATLCRDGHAALITTATGRHGIVFTMGADTTARYLDNARVTPCASGLRVDLPDFTAPHIHLKLEGAEITRWRSLIKETT